MMKSTDNVWIYLILLNSFFYLAEPVDQRGPTNYPNLSSKLTAVDDFTRNKRADDDSCNVPAESLDKTIVYKCPSVTCDTDSGYVPRSTVATVSCKPNFHSEKRTSTPSVCLNNTWSPPIEDCFKKCGKLNPMNVDLRCFRNGAEILCNENTLIAGTKVRPTCKPFHKYRDVVPDYLEITCEEDGKWDKTLLSCIPECGLFYTNSTHTFENPWHVAIYNSKKSLICSGTIISQSLVLTAAHCFPESDIHANNTSNYEVVTSKVTRNYNTKDNDNQKSYKIKEIKFSSKGYFGPTDQYSSDIAVLVLEEKLKLGAAVLPVCVDWITPWTSLKRKPYLAEGTPVEVSGWGVNERGALSENVRNIELKFVGRKRCLEMVPSDFRQYVTFDKFCATTEGARQGQKIMEGNGGAGLLYLENPTLSYVRGIFSLIQPTTSKLATFTDLADHIEWISALHNEIDNNTSPKKVTPETSGEHLCQRYGVSNCVKVQDCSLTDVLIAIKKAIFCGYDSDDSERICCAAQYPTEKPPSPTETPLVSPPVTTIAPDLTTHTRIPSGIAATYCEKYSKPVTACVKDVEPRIGEIKPAQDKEFPHMAVIGCGSDTNFVYGCLMGSLISESFILSVPPKDTKMITKFALLGNVVKHGLWGSSQNNFHIIDKRYFHPDYNFPHNSIALYKLQTPLVAWSAVRPACLYSAPDFNLFNVKFRTASWGNSRLFDSGSGSTLFKTTAVVTDDRQCSSTFERGSYDPKSMACVANLTKNEAYSLVHRGSPLKVSTGNKPCVWSIFAVFSEKRKIPKSGEDSGDNLFIYTKVSYFMDWIEGIVWPTALSSQTKKVTTTGVKKTQFGANPPDQQSSSTAFKELQWEVNKLSNGLNPRSPEEIVSAHCEMYSKYATGCVSDGVSRGSRKKALAKEYPHIALIGCESSEANAYWTSTGSLISEQFVLSTAYCGTNGKGKAKWVHLGALIKATLKSEIYDEIYDVEQTYIHPQYDFPRHSIALYKLKTAVEFTQYIRPACLYTSNADQLNSKLRIASWGSLNIQDAASTDLLKGTVTVVGPEKCSNVRHYNSSAMACIGDVTDGEALCLITSGIPVQLLQGNSTCLWTIFATHFGHLTLPESCDDVRGATPQLFTKVSYYLDWIQSIVWPHQQPN